MLKIITKIKESVKGKERIILLSILILLLLLLAFLGGFLWGYYTFKVPELNIFYENP